MRSALGGGCVYRLGCFITLTKDNTARVNPEASGLWPCPCRVRAVDKVTVDPWVFLPSSLQAQSSKEKETAVQPTRTRHTATARRLVKI